jgi:hypothetical protein
MGLGIGAGHGMDLREVLVYVPLGRLRRILACCGGHAEVSGDLSQPEQFVAAVQEAKSGSLTQTAKIAFPTGSTASSSEFTLREYSSNVTEWHARQ